MKRLIIRQLHDWKASKQRKPLILNGARQVGKTFILQYFAKQAYQEVVYLNFDEQPQLCDFFQQDLDPERIIHELEIYFGQSITAGKTLIIFDEIQQCSQAIVSLKYFCEKASEYHVAAAGSLLGVKLTKGFPVGKVDFLHLAPMSFIEFLIAMDEQSLCDYLQAINCFDAITQPFHDKLIRLLKYYFIIGGMPEAVACYIETKNLGKVRKVQENIINAYALDFAKHAPKEDVMKIMRIWDSIPNQLAKENKKFIFSALNKSARAREYESSIQWLHDAGLIIKTNNISTAKLPLTAYANFSAFKVYLLDIGLLGAMSKLAPAAILEDNRLFTEFKGALTENYAAQELHLHFRHELYYWTSEATAEVDFVISDGLNVYPLEVKAGTTKHKKSLLVFGDKYLNDQYHVGILSRATLRNFEQQDNLVNYPLYAICLFPIKSGSIE